MSDDPCAWEQPLNSADYKERDFDAVPYDRQERRAARYLACAGAGGGPDPVGFLITSNRWSNLQRRNAREELLALVEKLSSPHAGQVFVAKDYSKLNLLEALREIASGLS